MKEEIEALKTLEEPVEEASKEDAAPQVTADDTAEAISSSPPEEKKKSRGRKKAKTDPVAAPEEAAPTLIPSEGVEAVKKPEKPEKTEIPKGNPPRPRLKAHLRRGFQLKGRYYSRTELGRNRVLEKLYQTYPGLFE